jgi:hypothetical protein
VAIVYNSAAGTTRLSHFESDFAFKDAPWDGSYLWQEVPDLELPNRTTVVAFLLNLNRSRPQIPFGFRKAGCRFLLNAETGEMEFRTDDAGTGLTCSSFVALVFDSLHLPILNEATWPTDRPEDAQWRENIIALLVAGGMPPERALRIKQAQSEARVRPEEMAGAFVQMPWPVSFDAALAVAAEIVAELEEVIPKPPPAAAPQAAPPH